MENNKGREDTHSVRTEQRDRESHREDQGAHVHKVEMSTDHCERVKERLRAQSHKHPYSHQKQQTSSQITETQTLGNPEKGDESQASH